MVQPTSAPDSTRFNFNVPRLLLPRFILMDGPVEMGSKHDFLDRTDFTVASISARTSRGLRRYIGEGRCHARHEGRSVDREPPAREEVTDFPVGGYLTAVARSTAQRSSASSFPSSTIAPTASLRRRLICSPRSSTLPAAASSPNIVCSRRPEPTSPWRGLTSPPVATGAPAGTGQSTSGTCLRCPCSPGTQPGGA
jgi:hypothetical protein